MHRDRVRITALVLGVTFVVPLGASSVAQSRAPQEPREAKAPKPPAEVRDALAEAARENRRVLLLCAPRDFEPGKAFRKLWDERKLSRLLLYEYVRGELDAEHAWARRLLGDGPKALACLAILDARGKLLGKRGVESFAAKDAAKDGERGAGTKRYDPSALRAWLEGFKPAPHDARAMLTSAQALAKKTKRNVFVHLGAPW